MGLEIPESKDIQSLVQSVNKLVQVNVGRLEIEEFIAKILGAKSRAYFDSITQNGLTIKGEIKMAELREGQFIDVSVALKTKAGNPAKYQTGTEKFDNAGDTHATVGPDPNDPTNPLKARLTGVNGADNSAGLLTFTADGDPDDDNVRDIVATLDYVVTQGEAFVAELTATAPADLP